jgi:cytochrome c-type biogenesis protein CcmH/NrfG
VVACEVVVTAKFPWIALSILLISSSLYGGTADAQSPPVRAQSAAAVAPGYEMRAAYHASFQETLRNPSDPATLIAFAEIAIKTGDLEGAISALDRLLLIDGDQPEVKLELGVLYFRLGSFEAARTYLGDVRFSQRASAALKARAEEFLKAAKRP